jgi:hypothetical protein
MTTNQAPTGFHKCPDSDPDETWLEGPKFPTGTALGPILTAYEDGRMLIAMDGPCELTVTEARRVIGALIAAVAVCEAA